MIDVKNVLTYGTCNCNIFSKSVVIDRGVKLIIDLEAELDRSW